ncbi:MAG: phosphotransferase family protein, partial [Acidiferrobacteraceae bacterium]|nr:phosphotransferase family protein [Acidiferrobacteraceae bacterium]
MNKENIDFARLNGYLESAIPGIGLLQSVDKFTGGQSNPTYRVQSTGGTYVL